jgi:hypothetical protein
MRINHHFSYPFLFQREKHHMGHIINGKNIIAYKSCKPIKKSKSNLIFIYNVFWGEASIIFWGEASKIYFGCLMSDDGSLGLGMSRAFGDFFIIDMASMQL